MARKRRKRERQQGSPQANKPAGPAPHNPFREQKARLAALLAGDTAGDSADDTAGAEGPAAPPAATPEAAPKAPPAAPQTPPPADDEAAFLAAMGGDIAPLRPKGRVAPPRPRPVVAPRAATSAASDDSAHDMESAAQALIFEALDRPSWARDPGDPALDELLRGALGTDKELDLHGLFLEQAIARLRAFVGEARQRRWRVVRIIHGQGHRGDGQGVLRSAVRSALVRPPLVQQVRAWCEAMEGGAGATLVLLDPRRGGGR